MCEIFKIFHIFSLSPPRAAAPCGVQNLNGDLLTPICQKKTSSEFLVLIQNSYKFTLLSESLKFEESKVWRFTDRLQIGA